MPTKLSAAIRNARVATALTQGQLAGLLGVHENAISRWESGHGRPAKRNRQRILDALAKIHPASARTLAQAIAEAFPPKRRKGQPPPTPAPAAPPAPVFDKPVWVEQAIFRMADRLDVSPRIARGAARRLLTLLARGHVTTEEALAELQKPETEETAV